MDKTFAQHSEKISNYVSETFKPEDSILKEVKALREFNSRLSNNPKFRSTILPTGEGLTIASKVS